jgi:hypothetical protein
LPEAKLFEFTSFMQIGIGNRNCKHRIDKFGTIAVKHNSLKQVVYFKQRPGKNLISSF